MAARGEWRGVCAPVSVLVERRACNRTTSTRGERRGGRVPSVLVERDALGCMQLQLSISLCVFDFRLTAPARSGPKRCRLHVTPHRLARLICGPHALHAVGFTKSLTTVFVLQDELEGEWPGPSGCVARAIAWPMRTSSIMHGAVEHGGRAYGAEGLC
jgi:hypothetical protein